MKLPGAATVEGTTRYRDRFAGKIPPEHFREVQGLWMSSIGLGTYLGNYDDATDQQYHRAVVRAVESGCNVIDSAINYRLQRSERSIGTALKELSTKGYGRDEIIIATKGGFIPYDGTPPQDTKKYIEDTFIKSGILDPAADSRFTIRDSDGGFTIRDAGFRIRDQGSRIHLLSSRNPNA